MSIHCQYENVALQVYGSTYVVAATLRVHGDSTCPRMRRKLAGGYIALVYCVADTEQATYNVEPSLPPPRSLPPSPKLEDPPPASE